MRKISTFLVITLVISMLDFLPAKASTVDASKEYDKNFGLQLSNEYGIAVYNLFVNLFVNTNSADGGENSEFVGLPIPVEGDTTISLNLQDLHLEVQAQTAQEAESLVDIWAENKKSEVRSEVYAAMDAFVKDYPQVYWIAGTRIGFTLTTATSTYADYTEITADMILKVTPNLYFSGADSYIPQVCDGIIRAQNDIINQYNITENTNDVDILRAIHDYIANKVNYNKAAAATDDSSYQYAHTILPVFIDGNGWNNSVVCEGYAKAFKILADRFGLDTAIMVGSSVNPDGEYENHMWNVAKVEGKWYGVDVTWDDQTNKIYHTYFLAGNGSKGFLGYTFSRDHIATNIFSGSTESSVFSIPVITDEGYYREEEIQSINGQQNATQNITEQNQTTAKNEVTTTKGKNENNGSKVKEEVLKLTVKYTKNYVYTGKAINAKVVVVVNGKTLVAGKDYEVKYSNNIKVGKAKGVIKFKGGYSKVPAYNITYTISKISVNNVKCSNIKLKKAKNGKITLKSITYKINGKKVKVGKDITVKYKWSKTKLKITVKGKGVYTGSKVINIKIK